MKLLIEKGAVDRIKRLQKVNEAGVGGFLTVEAREDEVMQNRSSRETRTIPSETKLRIREERIRFSETIKTSRKERHESFQKRVFNTDSTIVSRVRPASFLMEKEKDRFRPGDREGGGRQTEVENAGENGSNISSQEFERVRRGRG